MCFASVLSAEAATLTTLFSFDGAHGSRPLGSLTLSGSTLYGTTFVGGGPNDYGTVFSMPVTGGTPTTLFVFDLTHGRAPTGQFDAERIKAVWNGLAGQPVRLGLRHGFSRW